MGEHKDSRLVKARAAPYRHNQCVTLGQGRSETSWETMDACSDTSLLFANLFVFEDVCSAWLSEEQGTEQAVGTSF